MSRATSSRTFSAAHSCVFIRVLPAASSPIRRPGGCLRESGGRGRAQQKGSRRFNHDAFTFARPRLVHQLVRRLDFYMEAPVQKELPLLGRIDGPDVVPTTTLRLAKNYREAVRLCWALRRAKGMRPIDLGRYGFTRQHVTDYLNEDDAPKRRNLPPWRIREFEDLMGNSAISQWIAGDARLTVLEELQAERAAA